MYEDIKKIYDSYRLDFFIMAVTQLMCMGWGSAEALTDEEIEEQQGNGLMTQGFVQDLLRLTREIAQTSSPVQFIQFCQAEKLFDTKGFKTRKKRK